MDKLYDWEELAQCRDEYVINVRERERYVDIELLSGFTLTVPLDICNKVPVKGEKIELVSHHGVDIGYPIRGIRIGGRIYRVPPEGCAWADPNAPFEFKGAL